MKNSGFTLIELLAVIVILAVIALITIPVVSNSVKKSKASAALRKAELYADAIEQSILDRQVDEKFVIEDSCYQINDSGNICLDEECTSELVVNAKNKYDSGTVCVQNKVVTRIVIDGEQVYPKEEKEAAPPRRD